MDNAERLLSFIANDWQTIILIILLFIFVFPELVEKIGEIKQYFGIVSAQERRFLALENAQKDLIEENKKLHTKISKTETSCSAEIKETAEKFTAREFSHWEESKTIRNELEGKVANLDCKLDRIIEQLDKKENLDFKKLRNEIVQLGEAAVERGCITIRQLKSLEELYSEYVDTYQGNSYVVTLMIKVRELEVIGKLNEHGEDIE